MATHFFTSITANYLPKARVLAESVRKFHPAALFHVILNDALPTLSGTVFDTVFQLDDLSIGDLKSWIFKHNLVELSTASKGFALRKILALPGCDHVIYLDPDIVVLSPLTHLIEQFSSASILLTPHLTELETQGEAIRDNELSVLQHGIFNLGFLGVKNSPEGNRFAAWWTDRLRDFCYDEISRGLFTDQRWADLIPAFFPDHKILRDAAYNVATWNLTSRTVTGDLKNGLLVNGAPLAFFHFSGLDSGRQADMLERYGSAMPALFELREWYLAECERNGQTEFATLPWRYGFYDSGESILSAHRKTYRENDKLSGRFLDPFAAGYLDWFNLQSRTAPAASAGPAKEIDVPGYRIFLIAAPADLPYLPETLIALQSQSAAASQIWLITGPAQLNHPDLPPDLPVVAFDALRYEDFAAFVLGRFSDKDLILIRAGAQPPSQWDLRLAWSAAASPSALTVSPLDRRTLDETGLLSHCNAAELDRLCYWYRESGEEEIAAFSHDCVYIKAKPLRDVIADWPEPRLSLLADRAARFRYRHLQVTHLCLGFVCPRNTLATADADRTNRWSLRRFRDTLRGHGASLDPGIPQSITETMSGVTLHVMHSWGGGGESWLRNFSRGDRVHANLVLRSVGPFGVFGSKLQLFRYGGDDEPELLAEWKLAPEIRATALHHPGYREILAQIVRDFDIARIFVSSLIGHSLDALRLGLPTVFICHDYYPFCSAINLSFGETCRSCEAPRLQACIEENPHNHYFPNVARDEWLDLRAAFLQAVRDENVTLVAPSPSVKANYVRLVPDLESRFQVVPHGGNYPAVQPPATNGHASRPLRILMLGSLGLNKGLLLFESLLSELQQFADLTLAGCFDFGERLSSNPNLHVIPRYEQSQLSTLVADVQPDVGLLLSIVPETFSFTLQELQSLGVPPVATALGSLVDWIQNGVNGFVCEPERNTILNLLRELSRNPAALGRVRENLRGFHPKSVEAMVGDYASLTPVQFSSSRYFSGPHAPEPICGRALKLYWREHNGNFSEENSFQFIPAHLRLQTARLYFPPSLGGLTQLRLDFGSEPGVLSLRKMVVFTQDDQAVWSWSGGSSLFETSGWHDAFAITGSALCLTGNDPYLLLPLAAPVLTELSRGGWVDVKFAFDSALDHAKELVSNASLGFTAQQDLASLQFQLSQELERIADELTEFHDEMALVNEKTERSKQLEDQCKHLEEQRKRLEQDLRLSQNHSRNLEDINKTFLSSLSWRLTKPVRLAVRVGRKITTKSVSPSSRDKPG